MREIKFRAWDKDFKRMILIPEEERKECKEAYNRSGLADNPANWSLWKRSWMKDGLCDGRTDEKEN